MFEWKGPITDVVFNKIKEGATDLLAEYISVLPILLGVAIGVYALVGMISKTLARLGVAGVLGYGVLIVMI